MMNQDSLPEVSIIETLKPLAGMVELTSLERYPQWAYTEFAHLRKYYEEGHFNSPDGVRPGEMIGLVINNVQYLLLEDPLDRYESSLSKLCICPKIYGECFSPTPVLLRVDYSVITLSCPQTNAMLFQAGEEYDCQPRSDYANIDLVLNFNELEFDRFRLAASLPSAQSKPVPRL